MSMSETTSPIETPRNQAERRVDTASERQGFDVREISFEGIMSWEGVRLVTGLSRPTVWREEKAGRFPARVQLTGNRVGWHGREVKQWIESRPRVNVEAV